MTDSAADTPEETPETTDAPVETAAADDVAMPDSSAAVAAAEETGTIAGSVTEPEDATEAAAKAEAEAAALKDLPRPRWRFSGKRGRPVHERDAVNKLPAEVRDVVEQFVRTVQEDQPAKPAAAASAPTTTSAPEPAPAAESAAEPAAEPEVVTSEAVAEPTAETETPAPVATATTELPSPSAGADELHLAVALIGQPPVQVLEADTAEPEITVEPEAQIVVEAKAETVPEAAPAPVPAPEPEPISESEPEIAAAAKVTPEAPADTPAELEVVAEVVPEPIEKPAQPAAETSQSEPAPRPSRPAASGPSRPRGKGRGNAKRRRNSLAWDKQSGRNPVGDREAPGPIEAKLSQQAKATRPPEVIARLSSPLHVERSIPGTLVEPRVARRRSIARRAELDSALADLQTFVESTTTRR